MDTFASRLRNRRDELKLNQTQLAERCGLSQTDISKLEKGKMLKTTEILSLAAALECNPYWLFYGDGEKLARFEPPAPGATDEIKLQVAQLAKLLSAINPEDREKAYLAAVQLWIGYLPTSAQNPAQRSDGPV